MKAVVTAFNQEKALVGAFSVITNLRMDIRFKLYYGLCITYPLRYFQGSEVQDGPAAGQTALLPGLLRQAAGPLRQHPHRTRIVMAKCDTSNDY